MLALAFSGSDPAKDDLMSMIGSRPGAAWPKRTEEARRVLPVLLAGSGRPARTPFGFLVRALPVVVPASKCGVCCLSLIGPRICWRVGGMGDVLVEALFPQGRKRFELGSSGWSGVLGIDAVGGPPHCDSADKGGARVASRCSPDWLGVTFAGVIVGLVGEVGDQLGLLCQVGPPDGMVMQR